MLYKLILIKLEFSLNCVDNVAQADSLSVNNVVQADSHKTGILIKLGLSVDNVVQADCLSVNNVV